MSENLQGFTRVIRTTSNSSMSINGDVDVPLADDQLIQILECPICAEFPSPPIFSCARGHFICNGCIRLVDACTTCLSPFTQVRNYPLEAIVERTKFKCRYRDLGCEESVMGATYLTHVDNCLFRPLKCIEAENASCYLSNFYPNTYLQHLISSHQTAGEIIDDDDPLVASFTQKLGDKFDSTYVKFLGRYDRSFLLHTRKHKSFICWWVTCLAMKDKGRQATLTWSKIQNAAVTRSSVDKTFIIKWKVEIQHENQQFEEIRDSGNCAVLPLQHLNQFKTDINDDGPETVPRWVLGLDIAKTDNMEDGTNSNVHAHNNAKSLLTTIQHYSPLLALIIIGIVVCLYYGLQDKVAERNAPEIEYYGHRGFYFPKKTTQNKEF